MLLGIVQNHLLEVCITQLASMPMSRPASISSASFHIAYIFFRLATLVSSWLAAVKISLSNTCRSSWGVSAPVAFVPLRELCIKCLNSESDIRPPFGFGAFDKGSRDEVDAAGKRVESKGSNNEACSREYVILEAVRAARFRNGESIVDRGTAEHLEARGDVNVTTGRDYEILTEGLLLTALSNSSRYMSAKWYARLLGTRLSVGLKITYLKKIQKSGATWPTCHNGPPAEDRMLLYSAHASSRHSDRIRSRKAAFVNFRTSM